jgi:hypothetical protein
MPKYQERRDRIPGFSAEKTRQIVYRRRGVRQVEVVINGQIVAQIEAYATNDGFFIEGRGSQRFTHKLDIV